MNSEDLSVEQHHSLARRPGILVCGVKLGGIGLANACPDVSTRGVHLPFARCLLLSHCLIA